MAATKAFDVAYIRFSAPDLDKMEDFMLNFGMERSYRTPDRLYMRGTGKSCCINAGNMPSQSPPPPFS
jgi:hypothetical protein